MSKIVIRNNINNDFFKLELSNSGKTFYLSHSTNFGIFTKYCQIDFANTFVSNLIYNSYWYISEYFENDKFTQ